MGVGGVEVGGVGVGKKHAGGHYWHKGGKIILMVADMGLKN